jgi:ADP-heptose:LPS heptosyltransferase
MLAPDRHYLRRPSAVKRWAERLLVAPLRLLHGRPSLPPTGPRRVLLIRHNQLGDAVVCGPLIDAVRSQWPQAAVEVLASPYNAQVFGWMDGVDRVWVRPAGRWAWLRLLLQLRGHFDLVLQTLFDENYVRRGLAAWLVAGRGVLVGRARHTPLEGLMDHPVVLPEGIYPGKLLALLQPLGAPPPEQLMARHPALRLRWPAAAQAATTQQLAKAGLRPGPFVALNLSAREANRALGDEQAAAIARQLLAQGHAVLLMAAPSEGGRLSTVQRQAPGATVLAWPSLAEAMAAVAQAALYIGPDTGTVHFAAAAQVPCVVLFHHAVRAAVWSPYGVPHIALQAAAGQPVPDIPVDAVINAATELLAGSRVQRLDRCQAAA